MDGTGVALEPAKADSQETLTTPRRSVGVRSENLGAKTLALYDGDWARFAAFCAGVSARALPASSATVIAFLQEPGSGRSALARRLAAIDHRHGQFSFSRPGDVALVRAALKAARKAAPRRSRPPPPAAVALRNMAGSCRRDLAGLRDHAVLLLLAAGLSRRELVGLQVEDLRWTEDGVRSDGNAIWIPPMARHDLCPVRALEDWLRAADLRYGPVFRKVTRWGTIEPFALGVDAVRRILVRHSP